MATKFCSNCGQQVEATSSFCPYCGLTFEVNAQQPVSSVGSQGNNYGQSVQAPEYAPSSTYYPSPEMMAAPIEAPKKKSAKGLIIALIVVILLAAAAVGSYFLFFNGVTGGQQQTNKKEADKAEDPVYSFFKDVDWTLTVDDLKEDDTFTYKNGDDGHALFTAEGFGDLTDGTVEILCSAPDGVNVKSYFISFPYEGDDIIGDLTDIYGEFENIAPSGSSAFYLAEYNDSTKVSTNGQLSNSKISILFTNTQFEGEDSFYISYLEWGEDKNWALDDFDDYYTRTDGYNVWFEFDGFETLYSGPTKVLMDFDDDGRTALCGAGVWIPYSDSLFDDVIDYFGAEYDSDLEAYCATKGSNFIAIRISEENIFMGIFED